MSDWVCCLAHTNFNVVAQAIQAVHQFAANQFRLLLATLAYTLMHRLRETTLHGTELERTSATTIRVRLLKIGAAIVCNTRRVRLLLASHHPLHHLYAHAARSMAP